MKEDSIIKIFRTRIAGTALQTFRNKKLLDEVKSKNGLVSELYSLFTELESKYNLLNNDQLVKISNDDLSALLQTKVSKESISFIGSLVTLDNDDTLISLENCMAILLEIFQANVYNVGSKFEGTPDLVGKFVDVEIVDVYTNSLRGKIVRTEAEMGLRIAESPESVIARTRKENDLGVGIYQP